MLGSKAVGERNIKTVECSHLPIEPVVGVLTKAVGPADAGPHVFHTKVAQQACCLVQSMVLEVNPLADTQLGRKVRELLQRELGAAVLAYEAHVEVTVVRGAFSF